MGHPLASLVSVPEQLRFLKVAFHTREDFQALFNVLELHSLRCLHVVVEINGINRLVLNPGPKFFYADLIRAMKCAPGSIEFEFIEGRYSDEEPVFNQLVLYELTLGPAGPVAPFLPNLKTLSLIGRLSNDLPDATLVMLNSRTSPPSSLEALFLQLCPAKNSWIPGENRLAADPGSVLNATDARTMGKALAGTALKIFIDQSSDDDPYDDGIPNSIAFPPL
ncbi:hypothetical protein HWV62_11355 [Athelia sp. TMB]|nr:hypothetical protein HWV62_11355 [Athelia sp. TMB]